MVFFVCVTLRGFRVFWVWVGFCLFFFFLIFFIVLYLFYCVLFLVFLTGVVSAAPGFATILMAGVIGILIDRLGALRSMIIFLISAIICLALTSLVQNIWQLIILRFILGISDAALIPSIQVLTVQNVPKSIFGRVFSYNQSAQSFGNVLGPMIAAWIAIGFGYKSIFLFSAFLELIALGTWLYYSKQRQLKHSS